MNKQNAIIGLLIGILISTSVSYATQQLFTIQSTFTIPSTIQITTSLSENDGSYHIQFGSLSSQHTQATFTMTNEGSGNVDLTWTSSGLPQEISVGVFIGDSRWLSGEYMTLTRGTTKQITIELIDNGTPEGDYSFNLACEAK